MEKPIERHKRILSPIWLLPLVALCIGGWLLYTSFRDAAIDITVHFADAKGITPGKTKVIFKGIPIGTVTGIDIDDDMEGVDLLIEMENRAGPLLVEDTTFWVVKPEVSAGRISGLETLLGGAYIGTSKGSSAEARYHFKGLNSPPSLSQTVPGLRFTLESDTLYSLQRGSHIYTKNLQIGHIEDYTLRKDGKILFNAFVKPEFAHLIKAGTRFWNASGLSLTGNLRQGLTVSIESLASLIYGGITCDTHPSLEDTAPAEPESNFRLYKDFEAAEYGVPMTLQLTSGDGIVPGKTQVKFRGLKVGVVKHLDINDDVFHTVTALILLDPRAKVILREATKFWVIKPEVKLTGIENLGTLIGGNYITFTIGEGKFRNHFTEEPDPMPNRIVRPGTSYSLQTYESGSLEIGAPVLYKQLQVGELTNIILNTEKDMVTIDLFVYAPYDQLVRTESVFWNVSGVQIKGSLSNFKVNLASLQTMFAGGVAFTNPRNEKQAAKAPANKTFHLFPDYAEAVKLSPKLQPEGLIVHLKTEQLPALSVGSPILYNNIHVGRILDFKLADNNQEVLIAGLINKEYSNLISSTSTFFNVSGLEINASLQKGVEIRTGSIDSIVAGGVAFINKGTGRTVPAGKIFQLHKDYNEASHIDDIRLTLEFNHGSGISPKTRITYQGIDIGKIEQVILSDDLKKVIGTAYIRPTAANLFRQGSSLMLIRPEIGLTGVKHLETVLTGPYIAVTPGKGKQRRQFTVLEYMPEGNEPLTGLNIILEAARLGSLSKGSPIYFRQVQVGQVTGYTLSPTSQKVWININIEPAFTDLVYSGTKFWNSSGIRVSGGVLSGINVTTESMKALVKGGVSFATPGGEEIGKPAQNDDHFTLHPKMEQAWLDWQPPLPPPPAKKTRETSAKPVKKRKPPGEEDAIH